MTDSALYVAVLAAAIAHASWNAMVKTSDDSLLMLAALRFAGLLIGLAAVCLVPPPSLASLPFLLTATAAHYLYYAMMLSAYRLGDMNQVYPIAQGVAPLLVALLAANFADEHLGGLSFIGIVVLCAGVLLLARSDAVSGGRVVIFALLTGVAIASYSFASGLGVRRAESVLGYVAWLEIATGLGMSLVALVRRKGLALEFARKHWRAGLIAGALSVVGYATAVWAMSISAMAPIVALRESSVVFAAIIGSVFLHERFASRRIAAAAIVLLGAKI